MTTSWWEIQILCNPKFEESAFWRLANFGFSGTAMEAKGDLSLIRAYLPEINSNSLDLATLVQWLSEDAQRLHLPEPLIAWEILPEEDWEHTWKEQWHPQPIGDRLLIYPAWLEVPASSERLLLRLDPGAAFGTGSHITTQLCLESLEMHLWRPTPGLVIADIGCGSGILSLGALLLGAQQVYAVDTDELAVNSAKANRDLNQFIPAEMSVQLGSIEQLTTIPGQVDGIVCNILAHIIIDLIPSLTTLAKPNSWAILSGILLEQIQPVVDTLEAHNWALATLWKKEQWCCLNLRRS